MCGVGGAVCVEWVVQCVCVEGVGSVWAYCADSFSSLNAVTII